MKEPSIDNDKKKNKKKVEEIEEEENKKRDYYKNDDERFEVDSKLTKQALEALMKYHNEKEEKKESLLGNDVNILVQFGLCRAPGHASPKPKLITIPHPLYDDMDDVSVCLICKDASKPWLTEMLEELKCVKKILTIKSLRNKHGRYDQQRLLCSKYNVFMADDSILPLLASALGRTFFRTKKQPIAISFSKRQQIPFIILKALQSTRMVLSEGTCLSIRAGNSSMKPKHLVENVLAICKQAPLKVPRKWFNIESISIKTPESMALPIYNKIQFYNDSIRQRKQKHEDDVEEENVDKKKNDKQKKKEKKRKAKSLLVRALEKSKEQEETPNKKQKTNVVVSSQSKQDNLQDKEAMAIDQDDEKEENKNSDDDDMELSSSKQIQEESKQEEEEQPPKEKNNNKKDDDVKQNKKSNDGNNMELSSPISNQSKHDSEKKGSNSNKKKKKRKSVESNKEQPMDDNPEQNKKDTSPPEAKNNSATKKKKDKEQKVDNNSKQDAKETPQQKTFISAKKFTGSKLGYAFYKGKMGLGYYVDMKPVVDKAALAALGRMSLSPRGGQQKRKSKSPGRRRRRST